MSEPGESRNSNQESSPTEENILRITDELVYQVDRTKKMVIIVIAAIVIGIPVAWHVAPLLGQSDNFRIVGYFTIGLSAIFIALGVRQWTLLSKWTRRYRAYKELQKKVDEKLDFEKN